VSLETLAPSRFEVVRLSGEGPERFPIRWNHPTERESLRFKELEHVLIEKVPPLFRNMLEDGSDRKTIAKDRTNVQKIRIYARSKLICESIDLDLHHACPAKVEHISG
jgi:hypothetical protein